ALIVDYHGESRGGEMRRRLVAAHAGVAHEGQRGVLRQRFKPGAALALERLVRHVDRRMRALGRPAHVHQGQLAGAHARIGLGRGQLRDLRARLGCVRVVDGQASAAHVVHPVDGDAVGAARAGRVELDAQPLGLHRDRIRAGPGDLEVGAEVAVDRQRQRVAGAGFVQRLAQHLRRGRGHGDAGGRGAVDRRPAQRLVELAAVGHLLDAGAAAHPFAADAPPRDRRPVAVHLDAFADLGVRQHVDGRELHPQAVEHARGLGGEPALRHVRLALHEQHDAVFAQQAVDAGANGGIQAHGVHTPGGGPPMVRPWHHPRMSEGGTLHRVPRRPHAWLALFLPSQLLVALAWWTWGWQAGLPLMLLSHAPFVAAALMPRARLYAPVLSRLPAAAKQAWLTIDDGPSDDTLPILDLLDAHRAKATFFLVGERAAARPEAVAETASRGRGLGNRSHPHPRAWFWALGPRCRARAVGDAQRALPRLPGTPPRWVRSVVGMTGPFVAAPLKRHGLARVAWSARGFDAVRDDPVRVAADVERDLAPGAIILMHEGAPHGRSVEMVQAVLERLRANGYSTVVPD